MTGDPLRAAIEAFEHDASEGDGYVYTSNNRLSSRLATDTMQRLILGAVSLEGKSVLDVGCGDGYFTERYALKGRPRLMVGLEPAGAAVKVARKRRTGADLHFLVGDGHRLPYADDSFDVVMLNAMLHHDPAPRKTISEAFRVAPEVVILEPNGNNVGLKVIEKASRYHREHQERSYFPHTLLRWVVECGGTPLSHRFGGLVPMFCPDWMARTTKLVEPLVERYRPLAYLGCAVIAVSARRSGGPQ